MILLVKKRLYVGGLFFCLLILLCYSLYIFVEGRQAALSEIRSLCDEVIHLDRVHRLKEIASLSSSGYSYSDSDSVTILYSDGHVEKITKDTKSDDLTTEEKQHRVDQSFLLMENPINVVTLDSLFNLSLQQNKIHVHAALAYTANNDKTIYSNPDLTFYQSATNLSPIVTGVKEEIVIQAYVETPLFYVISRNWEHFISLLLIASCLFLGLFIATRYSKNLVTLVREEPRELKEIKENLLFDKEKGVLYFNGNTQVTLENYKLKIFILLLDSPEHFQTSEEIKKIVWGKVVATPGTLTTTIKRLRTKLEPIHDLHIIFENGGYRLDIL